jgi:PncC family amidohydrolase
MVAGSAGAARLAAQILDGLAAAGETVAVAESCTGGGLGAILTSIPGSSRAFVGGVIAYDDRVKRDLLAVSADILATHGAVSGPVATGMAMGVRNACGADWGVAITGVAGPAGGTEEKPVGTIWIAVEGPRRSAAVRAFDGNREAVRQQAVAAALDTLSQVLEAADE